jgi:hypothetical protein
MTYYEELGVSAAASHEEIRQAYRHLASLAHPDQCGDEDTRRLADLQMKRLKGMMELLLDPASRDRYDRSLMSLAAAVAGQPTPAASPRWDWRRLTPATIACAAVLLILVLGASPARLPLPPAYIPQAAGAMPAANAPQLVSQKTTGIPRFQPPTSEEDWEPLVTYAYESHLATPAVPFPEISAPNPPRQPETAAPAPALSGDWFYMPATSAAAAGNPPEYVELRLREEQGVLHGRYQARYRVRDQAISPNVAFQFEGTVAAEGGSLPWRGAGGAAGEVTFHLLPGGDLEVKWKAGKLGKELRLISGTATLVRRAE